jgi:hypothetical protein
MAISHIRTTLNIQTTFQETMMSFFDAPLARCEAVRQMVLTDETQAECAREHDCPPGFKCPLCGYFTESSGLSEESSQQALRADQPVTFARH